MTLRALFGSVVIATALSGCLSGGGGGSTSGDGDGDGDGQGSETTNGLPECYEGCGLATACGYEGFAENECRDACEQQQDEVEAMGCADEWAAAAVCSVDAFECDATEPPCEASYSAFADCVAAE